VLRSDHAPLPRPSSGGGAIALDRVQPGPASPMLNVIHLEHAVEPFVRNLNLTRGVFS